MKNLYIHDLPGQLHYPVVEFNFETGICELKGESFMENPSEFYEPIFEWLSQYFNLKKSITINMKLEYFNTSSSRFILRMLEIIKEFVNAGGNLILNWYFDKDDPDMKKEILDFQDVTGLEINIKNFN